MPLHRGEAGQAGRRAGFQAPTACFGCLLRLPPPPALMWPSPVLGRLPLLVALLLAQPPLGRRVLEVGVKLHRGGWGVFVREKGRVLEVGVRRLRAYGWSDAEEERGSEEERGADRGQHGKNMRRTGRRLRLKLCIGWGYSRVGLGADTHKGPVVPRRARRAHGRQQQI